MRNTSPESAFFWYPGSMLAQAIATEAIQARLPQSIAEVRAVVEAHDGFQTRSSGPGQRSPDGDVSRTGAARKIVADPTGAIHDEDAASSASLTTTAPSRTP